MAASRSARAYASRRDAREGQQHQLLVATEDTLKRGADKIQLVRTADDCLA